MTKLDGVRIIEIPKFKAISSELDSPDVIFGSFQVDGKLVKSAPPYDAPDLAIFVGDKVRWIWAANDWVSAEDAMPHDLIEFEGGIFAIGTADENETSDCGSVYNHIIEWINANGKFMFDDNSDRHVMCHRIGCNEVEKILGIAQQEIFVPIKVKC